MAALRVPYWFCMLQVDFGAADSCGQNLRFGSCTLVIRLGEDDH